MVVKTKYDLGDKVWFVLDNKIKELDITGLNICVDESETPRVEYTLHFNDKFDESSLYDTKEKLLETL